MSRLILAALVLFSALINAQEPAAKWWAHVSFLATDAMAGRDTGSAEHRKAAEYIAAEFKKAGLEPGGTSGYFQPIRFRSRRIVEAKSSLALVRPGGAVENVELGDEATFSMRIEPAPSVEAPIVFAGYGLQVPESKHDDLADSLSMHLQVLVPGHERTVTRVEEGTWEWWAKMARDANQPYRGYFNYGEKD